ncbi:MAG: phosphoenolpyruvate carboxykinase (GTP) [Spirochaetota bacterium]|nr:MAG: phosphoenolpyruvate carboxykinase (GTP) [Spirochaetota bacterium]
MDNVGQSNILKDRLEEKEYRKIQAIENSKVHEFLEKYIELCNPDSVFVVTDAREDIECVRQAAISNKEEEELAIRGHTVHFDGYNDQARDKKQTKFLLPEGMSLGANINAMEREEGLSEIHSIFKDIMKGNRLFVRFFSLGPLNSEFSISCIQLTDSAYVAHSEDLLYRQGYEQFKRIREDDEFFKFVHSAGRLENSVSMNTEKRRIYIDLKGNTVCSANTQYGGNTLGLKKLAMRLAIQKGDREGWLTEHMFILGVNGPGERVSYFSGAFPSLCGKTSTSMVEGERIIGDDIAYLRKRDGSVYGVNVEKGIFGIIQGVNAKDDTIIWKALHSEGEVIFSNVFVTEERGVYWIGKDDNPPEKGINHSGEWFPGKKDSAGVEVDISHKNARFTLDIKLLENRDPEMENPDGVQISGMIYGGRDSDTWVPVEEAFDWEHGIITKGASLESETTAATLGKEGVRVFNPMSNLDFLSITIGKYIQNNLDFGKGLSSPPRIYSVNYFLKDKIGNWLNEREDKRVWLKWMELRVHDEAMAIETPTGYIPKYEDLKRLFDEVLKKDYSESNYIEQFTMRIPENLQKIDRILKIYREDVPDTPGIVFDVLDEQCSRLLQTQKEHGDYVSPFDL